MKNKNYCKNNFFLKKSKKINYQYETDQNETITDTHLLFAVPKIDPSNNINIEDIIGIYNYFVMFQQFDPPLLSESVQSATAKRPSDKRRQSSDGDQQARGGAIIMQM